MPWFNDEEYSALLPAIENYASYDVLVHGGFLQAVKDLQRCGLGATDTNPRQVCDTYIEQLSQAEKRFPGALPAIRYACEHGLATLLECARQIEEAAKILHEVRECLQKTTT